MYAIYSYMWNDACSTIVHISYTNSKILEAIWFIHSMEYHEGMKRYWGRVFSFGIDLQHIIKWQEQGGEVCVGATKWVKERGSKGIHLFVHAWIPLKEDIQIPYKIPSYPWEGHWEAGKHR